MSRDRRLVEAYEIVASTMNLRAPQAEALREVREALRRLPTQLSACTPEQRREFLSFRSEWRQPYHPTFTLALATGLGKTRLAGAIIAFLWLANEARTFLILAPRRAVLRRFESALDPRFHEYLFVNPHLVPEPSIVRADEIDAPGAVDFSSDLLATGPRIYLLSPQLVATSERFSRGGEFLQESAAEALRRRGDLAVLVDEAHHVGKLSTADTTAWAAAIRNLNPCLQVGLTATPRGDDGENLLYEYPLNKALAEGKYTKAVQILVRRFPESASLEDVDRATVDYVQQRLERKRSEVEAAMAEGLRAVKPVAVFFARDIDHAEQVHDWIVTTGRFAKDEVLLTHSKMSKNEDEIERLLSIERTDNPVRVVINVMELMEGWDVTNVYVVAPLRAMATFTGALQSMGRGLRLPAGRRIGRPEVDTLDVVCFGRQSLEQIVREATTWEGHESDQSTVVKVRDHTAGDIIRVSIQNELVRDEVLKVRHLNVRNEEISLNLPPEALHRVREAIVAGVELAASRARITGTQERARLPRDRFIAAASMRVIRSLPEYLSDEKHFNPVRNIVERWLVDAAPNQDWVEYDSAEVGEEIARQLLAGVHRRLARYTDTGRDREVSFPAHEIGVELSSNSTVEGESIGVDDLPVYDPHTFQVGQPYRGWQKALHRAYAFDSQWEAKAAWVLDTSADVVWWVRNQPRRFAIPTPAGTHYPDFTVLLQSRGEGAPIQLLLEVKGDLFWEPPDSVAKLKARAAAIWCSEQNRFRSNLEYKVTLESDLRVISSWPELAPRLIEPV